MATTKITPQVLDLNAGRADYSLSATNTVTYVGASGGNQYVFNGAYGSYGVVNGTYVLSSVSSSHPIAIINNGKTSEISYTGAVNEGTGTGPDGNTYTFYSGNVTITVSGNFDTVSYYCQNHGYMGGKDNLIYIDSVGESGLKIPSGTQFDRPTAVAGQIRNNTGETSESSASCEEYYNGTDWQKINNVALPPTYKFNLLNWTGTAAEQTITGFGQQPDIVITKNYDTSSNSDPWYWFDSSRGATKYVQSSSNAAEATDAQTLKSFNSDGFVLGTNDAVNGSGHNTYGYSFRVNGGTTSSNTDGSVTSTVQANNDTGISIVRWTGTGGVNTIGHGLSTAPELILTKSLNSTADWQVYSDPTGNSNKLVLNSTAAQSSSTRFDSTSPTSSVFTLNDSGLGTDQLAYCFYSVSGFSSIGSYTGSGSQGSPSVTCGFKPDLLIVKRITGGTEQWWIGNSATNSSDHWTEWMPLQNNERLQTDTIHSITVTSTGFEPYGTSALVNASGSNYLYIAFKIQLT